MKMKTIEVATIVIALVVAFTGIVSADPDGVAGNATDPVTKPTVAAGQDDAQGGYITGFDLTVMQQTAKWQGYYGNITAEITLDDDNSATLYNWTTAAPTGEVYATTLNTLPVWSNFINNASLSAVDTAYGFVSGESDNTAETFSLTNHTAFHLAGNEIAAGVGRCAKTYEGPGNTGDWETVLLWDDDGTATDNYLFAGIIRDNTASYKNTNETPDTCDYQMIVPENPLNGTTTYYFYAELT